MSDKMCFIGCVRSFTLIAARQVAHPAHKNPIPLIPRNSREQVDEESQGEHQLSQILVENSGCTDVVVVVRCLICMLGRHCRSVQLVLVR